MQKFIIIVVLLVGFGYWYNLPASIPSATLDQYQGERRINTAVPVGGSCSESRCLIVYVAPWCSSCRKLTPTIDELAKELKSEGIPVSIVVGHDSLDKVKAYAKKYSEPIYEDARGDYFQALETRGVPFFATTDSKGKIKSSLSGGFDSIDRMREELEL